MNDLDIFTIDGNKINKLNSLYESELYDNKGLSTDTNNICLNEPFEFECNTNTDITNNTNITNDNFSKSKNDIHIVLYIQKRIHRKKRIDKKWLKRFGVVERKINCHININYNMKNIYNYEVKLNTTELTDFIKEMKQHRNRIYFDNPINN